jgi:N-carbamoyl-L-amino-acid hydrolase
MAASPAGDAESGSGSRPLKEIAAWLFDELRRRTADGPGVTRECFAEGEERAISLFREFSEAHGLRCWRDAGTNLIVALPDDDGSKPALLLSSHADSVPQGGNYDGAAGVIAGLLCLVRLKREHVSLAGPVRVLVMRGEEGAFYGAGEVGSRSLLGRLDPRHLDARRRGTGKSLREAMMAAGLDVAKVARGEPLADPAQFRGYLELHIEQGPVMIARKLAAAIVTGIRGNVRHRKVVCRGEAGHSGAVPRALRRDPVFAVADLLMRLDAHWRALADRGIDLVMTSGILGTDPKDHALSRIPDTVSFGFEIRSQSQETINSAYALFRSECDAVAAQRGVRFEFDDRIIAEPAMMNHRTVAMLVQAAKDVGFGGELIASGAGHDAAIFANAGIPSGMIFVRNQNGSHNAAEAMELDDFMDGVNIMYAAVVAGL